MHWLAIYDISDPKRLRKVANLMEAYGLRVQRSVFELEADPGLIDAIRKRVMLLTEDPDSVVFVPLCRQDLASVQRLGRKLYDAESVDPEDRTLFL